MFTMGLPPCGLQHWSPSTGALSAPAIFKVMNIPLLRGRDFTDADDDKAPHVLIVSEATARTFWGDKDPIGRVLRRSADPNTPFTVVGVVGNVRDTALNQESPALYYPVAARVAALMEVVVRTDYAPASLFPAIRRKVAAAELHVLNRSYAPVFTLLGSISGRGTGLNNQGDFTGGASGLAPTTVNWAAAVQVTFPAFDFFTIHQEKKVQAANLRSEQMRYQQTMDDLSAQVEQARATLDGARQAAQNTPIEVAAALQSEQQQRARFQSGLATVVDVAAAESVLTQAEGDDAIARLNVWRALAGLAVARGDVTPFLNLLGK
jgi:hypothetical protein